ncbi:hypothetical protein AX14_003727 [Amanita brunnescens Koide BX004]|nr:hypothetical protein AX14_003727 [Amanita brunnescens Koide BX004]
MDCNGLVMTIFHLPRTKTLINGEEVLWVPQDGIADPEVALNQQLQINAPPQGPPFAKAAWEAGKDPLQGHGTG